MLANWSGNVSERKSATWRVRFVLLHAERMFLSNMCPWLTYHLIHGPPKVNYAKLIAITCGTRSVGLHPDDSLLSILSQPGEWP